MGLCLPCRNQDGIFPLWINLSTHQANYDGNYPYRNYPKSGEYREKPLPVGSFPANAWGFHDVHGNVWEWCSDWYCDYPDSAVTDPAGNCETDKKVILAGAGILMRKVPEAAGDIPTILKTAAPV